MIVDDPGLGSALADLAKQPSSVTCTPEAFAAAMRGCGRVAQRMAKRMGSTVTVTSTPKEGSPLRHFTRTTGPIGLPSVADENEITSAWDELISIRPIEGVPEADDMTKAFKGTYEWTPEADEASADYDIEHECEPASDECVLALVRDELDRSGYHGIDVELGPRSEAAQATSFFMGIGRSEAVLNLFDEYRTTHVDVMFAVRGFVHTYASGIYRRRPCGVCRGAWPMLCPACGDTT